MRDSKGTTLDVFNLLFHSVHYWLELGPVASQSNSIRGFHDIQIRLPKLFNANFTGKMRNFDDAA